MPASASHVSCILASWCQYSTPKIKSKPQEPANCITAFLGNAPQPDRHSDPAPLCTRPRKPSGSHCKDQEIRRPQRTEERTFAVRTRPQKPKSLAHLLFCSPALLPRRGNRGDCPNFEPPLGIVEPFVDPFLLPTPPYLVRASQILVNDDRDRVLVTPGVAQ